MSVTVNNGALKSMTYNGSTVKTWTHNNVKVFDAWDGILYKSGTKGAYWGGIAVESVKAYNGTVLDKSKWSRIEERTTWVTTFLNKLSDSSVSYAILIAKTTGSIPYNMLSLKTKIHIVATNYWYIPNGSSTGTAMHYEYALWDKTTNSAVVTQAYHYNPLKQGLPNENYVQLNFSLNYSGKLVAGHNYCLRIYGHADVDFPASWAALAIQLHSVTFE